MSSTKTITDAAAVSRFTGMANNGLQPLQAAFTALQTAAENLTFSAFKNWILEGDFSPKSVRKLIVTTNLGNETPTIGGLAVSIDLVLQNAVIGGFDTIMAAVVELERNGNSIFPVLGFYSESSGTISVNTDAITTAYTRELTGAQYTYYAAVKSIVDSLKTFNETYNRKGLWLFENHTEITNFGGTITLREDTF